MANVDRTRKLFVRTALVTSSTIATLVGAQNLALQDLSGAGSTLTSTSEPGAIPATAISATAEPAAIVPAAPALTITHAEPSLVVLRRAGQAGPIQQPAQQSVSIQPPAPVEVAAPDPVIIQGEAPPPVVIQNGSSGGGGGSQPVTSTQSSR